MKFQIFIFIQALGCIFIKGDNTSHHIPAFLKLCRRSDPRLNECVKRSVEALRPYLKSGIKALEIPPCEPLSIPRVEIAQSAGPVSISSNYSDIQVLGGTDFILKSVRIDVDEDRIKLKLYIPRLEMKSEYRMRGKILMLPIIGSGQAYGNYSEIDAIVKIQGERYLNPRTNETHFRVVEFYIDFDMGHASMQLENLFDGDRVLTDAMNVFLNENWKTVAAEIKPALEQTVANLFKEFSNQIYEKYPMDVLLPP